MSYTKLFNFQAWNSFKFSQEWKETCHIFYSCCLLVWLVLRKKSQNVKKRQKINQKNIFRLKSRNMIQRVQYWCILDSQAFVIIHFVLKVVTLVALFQVALTKFLFPHNFSLPAWLLFLSFQKYLSPFLIYINAFKL